MSSQEHLEEPDQAEAHDAVVDVSSFTEQQREATFRFAFKGTMTAMALRALLAALSQKYDIDPGYVMIAQQDFRALKEELLGAELTIAHHVATLHIPNDVTGNSARIIASPDIEVGEVTFGVLYASTMLIEGDEC